MTENIRLYQYESVKKSQLTGESFTAGLVVAVRTSDGIVEHVSGDKDADITGMRVDNLTFGDSEKVARFLNVFRMSCLVMRGIDIKMDCYGSTAYVQGYQNDLTPLIRMSTLQMPHLTAPPNQLINGAPYVLAQQDKDEYHGVHFGFGVQDPSRMASVVGLSAPLVVANTVDLLDGYTATDVLLMTGPQPVASTLPV